MPVKALRVVLVVSATLLTTASVCVGGLIGWVGLVVPHLLVVDDIARLLLDRESIRDTDTATSSVGHDACRPRATKWVEGFCGQAAPYWPTELTLVHITMECSEGNRATIVHPNAAGHANLAAHVEAAVRAALCPWGKPWGARPPEWCTTSTW